MSRHRWSAATGLLTLVLIATCACGSTGTTRSVSVMASWTGNEANNFQQVLTKFTAETGIRVDYQGTRALPQVLAGDVQLGTPPDIAVLPSVGDVNRYRHQGNLVPLDDVVGLPGTSGAWQQLQRAGTPQIYAVPVKADLKSIIWYPKGRPPNPFTTVDQLATASADPRGAAQTWCLGMGSAPASGWPGTDWIEDIVLHQSGPDVYERWATGQLSWQAPEIRRAWTTWAAIIGGPSPAAATRGLLNDFDDAARGLFANPPTCRLDHQASFELPVLAAGNGAPRPGAQYDYVPFPSDRNDPTPIVSADMATMFTGSDEARQLMAFLASSEGQGLWPSLPAAGAFSADRQVSGAVYHDDVSRKIAGTLTQATRLCADASDAMPQAMASAFERAALEYLANPPTTDPGRLDQLLSELDEVRASMGPDDWLAAVCTH